MSLDEYKLSVELIGHSSDVRALATNGDYIVSGSRDKTAKIWQHNGFTYGNQLTLQDHTNFIGCVCIMEEYNWICTGSNDKTIRMYNAGNIVPFATLKHHTDTVCALAPGAEKGTLISGSWDKTAAIITFDESDGVAEPPVKLVGHEATVWSVVALKSGKYVTASADKTIMIWNKRGEKTKVLKGHTDCVRALLGLPDDSIISADNEGVIKIWNSDGECIRDLHGHTKFIYTLAFVHGLGENVFISGGEDSTLRMWNLNGPLGEAKVLPAESVWAVAALKNGDLVTGTSDGYVRIFTKDASRVADDAVLTTYDANVEVERARIRDDQLKAGGIQVEKLPGEEALLQKGKSKGQTKMIRHADGSIKAYEWNGFKWEDLGVVTGGNDGSKPSGKKYFEGKEYDYVFDVNIDDNMAELKLPYNKGEDPWFVAQNFIHKHELPQTYLDQVANFIITNSGGAQVVQAPPTSGYEDPFTGSGRYIPGSGSGYNSTGGNVDPFTGGSSYSTQSASVPVNFVPQSTGKNLDPFTGGSSHSTANVKHFPSKTYNTITKCDPLKILAKLKEFNSGVDDSFKVAETELELVIKLAENNSPPPESIAVMKKLLAWPKEKLFPVLDILRLAVCDANKSAQILTPEIMDIVLANVTIAPANQLMSIRVLNNMLGHEIGRSRIDNYFTNVCVAVSSIKIGTSNLQIAIASLLFNLTVIELDHPDASRCKQITESIIDFLMWNADSEALSRTYVAIGNLLSTPHSIEVGALVISADEVMEKLRHNQKAQQHYEFEKINAIAKDILEELSK